MLTAIVLLCAARSATTDEAALRSDWLHQVSHDPTPQRILAAIAKTRELAERLGCDVNKYATLRPMTALSYRSPLIELAMSGKHHDVTIDPESLRRLIAWVDTTAPYRGEPEVRALPDPDFPGIETLAIRPRTRTAAI